MSTALELVYQYRQLARKCERGAELTFDEIDLMTTIESLFVDHQSDDAGCRRAYSRAPVLLAGVLRDRRGRRTGVKVAEITPDGTVVRGAPAFDERAALELILNDTEMQMSYRFKTRVVWARDDLVGFSLGLRFIGTPLLLRYAGGRAAA